MAVGGRGSEKVTINRPFIVICSTFLVLTLSNAYFSIARQGPGHL